MISNLLSITYNFSIALTIASVITLLCSLILGVKYFRIKKDENYFSYKNLDFSKISKMDLKRALIASNNSPQGLHKGLCLYFVNMGLIKIVYKSKNDITISKIKDIDENEKDYLKEMFEYIFKLSSTLGKATFTSRMSTYIKTYVFKNQPEKMDLMDKKSLKTYYIFNALSMVLFISNLFCQYYTFKEVFSGIVLRYLFFTMIFTFIYYKLTKLVSINVKLNRKSSKKYLYYFLFTLIFLTVSFQSFNWQLGKNIFVLSNFLIYILTNIALTNIILFNKENLPYIFSIWQDINLLTSKKAVINKLKYCNFLQLSLQLGIKPNLKFISKNHNLKELSNVKIENTNSTTYLMQFYKMFKNLDKNVRHCNKLRDIDAPSITNLYNNSVTMHVYFFFGIYTFLLLNIYGKNPVYEVPNLQYILSGIFVVVIYGLLDYFFD